MIHEIIVAKNQRKDRPKKKNIKVIGEDMRAYAVNKSIVLRF